MAWLDAMTEEATAAAAIAGVRRYELRPRSRFQVRGYFSQLALREPVAVHLLWHAAPGEGSHELVELRFSRPVDPEAAQQVRRQAVGLERVDWRGYELYVAQTDWEDAGGPFPVTAVVVPLHPERQQEIVAERERFQEALEYAAYVACRGNGGGVTEDELMLLHSLLLQLELDDWAPERPVGARRAQSLCRRLEAERPLLRFEVWVEGEGRGRRVLTVKGSTRRLPHPALLAGG